MIFNRVAPAGGAEINGVIESYKVSTGSVTAGGFVEFVNSGSSGATAGTETPLGLGVTALYYRKAVALSDSRVLILHSVGNYNILYGMILTINGNVIALGTDTLLYNTYYSANSLDAVLLKDGRVFVSHCNASYDLMGSVLSITGTVITVQFSSILASAVYCAYASICLVDDKIFIAHTKDSTNRTLNYIVARVETTYIYVGIPSTALNVGIDTGVYPKAVAQSSTRVVVIYRVNPDNTYMYSFLVTLSGWSVSSTSNLTLSTNVGACDYMDAVVLKSGLVVIAHSYNRTNYQINIMTIAITSGGEQEVKVNALVDTVYGSASGLKILRLLDDSVAIFSKEGSTATGLAMIIVSFPVVTNVTVLGTRTIVLTGHQEGASAPSLADLIPSHNIFLFHTYVSGSAYPYGTVASGVFAVKSLSDLELAGGIATATASAENPVGVFVPYTLGG